MPPTRVAVLDDYLGTVRAMPHWAALDGRIAVDAFRDQAAGREALAERLRGYPIVVAIRERTRFDRALLERLPDLQLLAITGRNSGHVDLAAATALGILVADTDGSGSAPIELTCGLILALARRIPQEDRDMHAGGWQTGFGIELAGRTLGIVGLGRIGTRVAAFGRFLNMRVIAWSPSLTDERAAAAGAARVELDEVFRQADVVSIHARLTEQSRGIVDGRRLALMKPTAHVVNTARGPLVDEAALVAALASRRIAGAALDVYDVEPLPAGHPLRALDNVILAPHLGYLTREAFDVFFRQAVQNIDEFLEGRVPRRALNPDVARRPGAAEQTERSR